MALRCGREAGGDYKNNMAKVQKIIIPGSVRYIYKEWLGDSLYLAKIDVDDDNVYYRSEDGVLFTADNTLMLYPAGKENGSYTVPEGTVKIGEHAFGGRNYSLEEVTLPDSVREIEENAFNGCAALTSVKMGQGVETIGSEAFWGCHALTHADLPEGQLRPHGHDQLR